MSDFWYRLLSGLSKKYGSWLLNISSKCIAAGYFLFSRKRSESCRFYSVLFPGRGKLFHLWCTFRQYQNFTTIHLDRFMASQAQTATSTSQGWERLETVIGNQGGILLMSHLGNWEMAATLLKKKSDDLNLLLYMGIKQKEGVERVQKEDLQKSGVRIIGVDHESNSPFSAVEGIRFLQSGGLVSMAGDIIWRTDQRRVSVNFLGHKAYLPEAPFVFALVSKSPLFAFFAYRTGKNDYHFTLSEPISIQSNSRKDRSSAITNAAQQYANMLEKALKEHPYEWYHFDRFIY